MDQCPHPTLPNAGYGCEAAVALLLQLGADTSAAADRSGMAALHRAAARNHTGVLRLMLQAGAGSWQRSAAGQTPLMYACQFGHQAVAQLLLEHLQNKEQDPQQPPSSGGTDAAGGDASSQPLSSLQRHLALHDAAGMAALHLAAQWGMAEVAVLLLQAGAGDHLRRVGAGLVVVTLVVVVV